MASLTPKKQHNGNGHLPWEETFLAVFRKEGNIRKACEMAGISRQAVYAHREKSKRFFRDWEDAKDDAIDVLEAEAFRRAKKQSDVLLIFLLKSHRPGVYRETVTNDHTGSIELVQRIRHSIERAVAKPSGNGRHKASVGVGPVGLDSTSDTDGMAGTD